MDGCSKLLLEVNVMKANSPNSRFSYQILNYISCFFRSETVRGAIPSVEAQQKTEDGLGVAQQLVTAAHVVLMAVSYGPI